MLWRPGCVADCLTDYAYCHNHPGVNQAQELRHLQCWSGNRRFPEITGEDNLTVFSYSGRVKSPEWRRQRRRADLRHFEIFRHGRVIIYTRLPAGGTYFPICMVPTNGECLIGISDAFFLGGLLFMGIRHLAHVLTVTPDKSVPTLRYARRHLPSAVPWISEDRLLSQSKQNGASERLCAINTTNNNKKGS